MIVSLTEHGREAVIAAHGAVLAVEEQAFGPMRKSERLALTMALDAVIANLKPN